MLVVWLLGIGNVWICYTIPYTHALSYSLGSVMGGLSAMGQGVGWRYRLGKYAVSTTCFSYTNTQTSVHNRTISHIHTSAHQLCSRVLCWVYSISKRIDYVQYTHMLEMIEMDAIIGNYCRRIDGVIITCWFILIALSRCLLLMNVNITCPRILHGMCICSSVCVPHRAR